MRFLLALAATCAIGAAIYFAVAASSPSTKPAAGPSAWPESTPAAEGLDPKRFGAAIRRVETDTGSVLALLVARHGRLVFERYYHGDARDSGFDVYSITKSVTSALVGVAIGAHRIGGLDVPLRRFFGAEVPPRAAGITVRQLLTMTSGWPGDADPRNDIGDAPNVVRALLRRPVVHRPGTTFRYDTPSSHLLAAVLQRTTGMSEEAYARRHLFGPLGITLADYWPKDDQGVTYGGTGLTFVARDAAKLGQLYLQGGRWHGRQLVPRAWVAASTHTQVHVAPGRGYGYDWWTFRRGAVAAYTALGYGGQYVAVVPKLDLVVAVFSDPAGQPPDLERLLFRELAPTVRR
jgi:CubicO group peptidase (beta-lactamase class C family)